MRAAVIWLFLCCGFFLGCVVSGFLLHHPPC